MICRVRMLFVSLLVMGAVASLPAQNPSTSAEPLIYIRCGRLIDGTGGQLRSNVTVVIKNDRISEIRTGAIEGSPAIPTGLIDLHGETCLPGLIDAHHYGVL